MPQAGARGGATSAQAAQKCGALYANGVQAGASAQRSTTLTHLLTYSLLSLAGVILLAAVAGWIVAGRILRPVHRLTAAARAASEQNLSQRIALQGPRDELRELADTFDTMLERLDRAFTSQRQFIANASHELRTPLTVMRTTIDVVLAKPDPTRDELVSMATDVRQAVDHAERLIDALLVLARNDQARALTDPLDLAAVAEDALEGRTRQRHHDDHHARRSPGDRRRSAARTARRQPARQRRALQRRRRHRHDLDQHRQRRVPGASRQHRPGRPTRQVDRLFLPFTRLDDRTRHDGFGLGLALVSSIATRPRRHRARHRRPHRRPRHHRPPTPPPPDPVQVNGYLEADPQAGQSARRPLGRAAGVAVGREQSTRRRSRVAAKPGEPVPGQEANHQASSGSGSLVG